MVLLQFLCKSDVSWISTRGKRSHWALFRFQKQSKGVALPDPLAFGARLRISCGQDPLFLDIWLGRLTAARDPLRGLPDRDSSAYWLPHPCLTLAQGHKHSRSTLDLKTPIFRAWGPFHFSLGTQESARGTFVRGDSSARVHLSNCRTARCVTSHHIEDFLGFCELFLEADLVLCRLKGCLDFNEPE